jgi:hypothetical protein
VKAIGFMVWLAVSSLLNALVQAWALRTVWRWFVAAEYGTGPSLGAWFGLASIAGVILTFHAVARSTDKEEDTDAAVRHATLQMVSRWIGVAFALGMLWLTGSLLGWVR